jgi:hypothetical protein
VPNDAGESPRCTILFRGSASDVGYLASNAASDAPGSHVESLGLRFPEMRDIDEPGKIAGCEIGRLTPGQDRIGDLWRQKCQRQDAADVETVDADLSRQVCDRRYLSTGAQI